MTPAAHMTPEAHRNARLARLAANAREGQWSLEDAIDWHQEPRCPFWMTQTQVRKAVSQLYHGEVATSRLCARLIAALEDPDARACLEWQHADELRHAEAYRRYLERLGGPLPVDANLERALAGALQGPGGLLGAMVAFHIVVEGEALRVHDALARFLPCPLLRRINKLVSKDEARHVAFGRIYLKSALAALPRRAREDLLSWVRGLWSDCTGAALAEGRRNSRVLTRFLGLWLRGGWSRHAGALRQIGLTAEAQRADPA